MRYFRKTQRCLAGRPFGTDVPSFAAAISYQTHLRDALAGYAGMCPESVLNQKKYGFALVKKLGADQPVRHALGEPLRAVRLKPNTVIKPLSATTSWGAYYVFSQDQIVSIRDGRRLGSYPALLAELEGLLKSGRVNMDAWIVEALLLGPQGHPARDLKVYAFYGRAALALEVDRSPSKPLYCWWARNGEMVDTGKYRGHTFLGVPPDQSTFGLAETLSLAVPLPFIRIDFLVSTGGAYFSEFTPRPGGYDGFNGTWDQILGREFAQANARLLIDVLEGKKYPEYEQLAKSEGQRLGL